MSHVGHVIFPGFSRLFFEGYGADVAKISMATLLVVEHLNVLEQIGSGSSSSFSNSIF